ncbi:hypothetical protein FDG94_gp029 [Pseudomonas phage SM1]|uniref:DUF1257 domain-containing protein n=2 Tax=Samunavirus TaxID=2560221 RepID=A0A0U3CKA2_9CAUD|nr:hypothetical protein FDG94_gp029 [Pseudomonas phage SM1]ALT58022.1 hypothetical protein SM1_029 [Pseudomonas phage SM1]
MAELRASGMNIDIATDAVPRAYFQNQQGMGKAPYVIRLHDAKYDVGVYALPDGSGYELRTDFWGGSVERVVGAKASSSETTEQAKLGRIFQAYALNAAEQHAHQQGMTTTRSVGQDGAIELLVQGY